MLYNGTVNISLHVNALNYQREVFQEFKQIYVVNVAIFVPLK
jgi:hypothetical protein